jgi:integrase
MSDNVIPLRNVGVFPDVGGNHDALARNLRYLQLRGRSAATAQARGWLLARVQSQIGCPLTEASAADLMGWREGLAVDRDTVRTYVSHVRQFYAWARREGLIEDDPSLDLPVPPRRRRLPRPIGEDELLRALESAPPRIRPWLALAGWAGLRAKEIALLRREHVLDRAPQPGIYVATDATKGSDERYVPMHPVVRQALNEHGLPPAGWLFRRGDGKPGPNRPDLVSHLANRYLHGIAIRESLHQLRHRFGTQAYAVTRDLRQVQEWMGHRCPESTSGYVKVSDADAAAKIALIPGPAYLQQMLRGA